MASYADNESTANDKKSTKKDNTPYDLIPIYIFHYEGRSQLEELERSPDKLEQLKAELSAIIDHLEELVTQ